MNYSGIKYADMINGKGIRVSLFVSGCTHACKNCFNEETWKETYGKKFTEKEEDEIIEYFKKYSKTTPYPNISIRKIFFKFFNKF